MRNVGRVAYLPPELVAIEVARHLTPRNAVRLSAASRTFANAHTGAGRRVGRLATAIDARLRTVVDTLASALYTVVVRARAGFDGDQTEAEARAGRYRLEVFSPDGTLGSMTVGTSIATTSDVLYAILEFKKARRGGRDVVVVARTTLFDEAPRAALVSTLNKVVAAYNARPVEA